MQLNHMSPTAIEFPNLSGAVAYRCESGGYIFASDCGGRFIVFPRGRPAEIFTSPQTQGLSGSLI